MAIKQSKAKTDNGYDSGSVELGQLFGPARVTRAEALAQHLETEITTQGLAEGQHLGTKEDLRKRFGVAVATLNEAVRLMEMRGLVALRSGPGGGIFVGSVVDRARMTHTILGLDWEQATLRECLELRNVLEPTVVRRAAEKATEADIEELRSILGEMEAGLDDSKEFLESNWKLHRRIAEICSSAPLRSVYVTVIDFLEAGLRDFEVDPHTYDHVATHLELIDAIADGSPKRIDAAVKKHADHSPLPA